MKRVLMCLLLTAAGLHGQSPAERAMLSAWDDSLQKVTDPALIGSYQASAARGAGDTRTLRQTMLRLRSGLLRSNRGDIDNAIDNLASDITSHAAWPWPKFVMARALFALEVAHAFPNQTTGVKSGEAFGDAGWRYLRQAIQSDSAFAPARTLALRTMVAAGDREQHDDAHDVMMVMLADRFPTPDILLVYARELQRGKLYDSALKVLGRSALAGGDYSRLSYERARIYMALKDSTSAVDAYWAGLDGVTTLGREMYRYDLEWILTDDSLAVFDKVPADELKTWMRRFWTERDAAAANPFGGRLREQLRRWAFVLENYRSSQPWRRTTFDRVEMLDFDKMGPCIGSPPTDLYNQLGKQPKHPDDIRDRELLLDHRGVIYLRHGQPIATFGSSLFNPNQANLLDDASGNEQRGAAEEDRKFANHESWVYFFEGAWRVLNFQGSQAVGTYAPTTLRSYLPLIADAYMQLAPYIKAYGDVAHDINTFQFARKNGGDTEPLQCRPSVVAVVDSARRDAKLATNSDSDSPPIKQPWNALVHSFALGSAQEHNGKALVTFAVNVEDPNVFAAPSGDGRHEYPFTFRIIAYQVETDTWVEVDTLHHAISSKVLEKGWVTGWFEVPLGGGTWQVTVLANQGDPQSGAYVLQRDVKVDSLPGLSLSDLVTGRPGAAPWIATDQKPFPLNPTGVWPNKAGLELFYELRGLVVDSTYKTRIQVKDEDGKIKVSIEFSDQAFKQMIPIRKSIDISQLKKGNYQLIVTATSAGKSVERTAPIVVN